jgi:thioredoxin-like negative regulator of GroEL
MGALLDRVKTDDGARQELVDLLETMDASDPRREQYRRALASRLF